MRLAGVVVAVLVVLGGEGVASAAAKRPDLKLTRISVQPPAVAPGGTVRIADTVRNAGARKAKGAHVGYFLSKDARRNRGDLALPGRRKFKAIKRRKTARGGLKVTVPTTAAPGAYRLVGCADVRGKVRERSERNNCRAAAGMLRVLGAGVAPAAPPPPLTTPTIAPPAPPPPPPPGHGPGGGAPFPLTPKPLSVTDTLEDGNRVSASMGVVGEGKLTATANDGTTYTLTMPEGSLLTPVEVAMTPVASISGLPLSQGLIGAVQIEPHGLMLRKPATLTIDPPAGTSTAGATGFLYHQGGEDFHLYPADAGTLSMSLLHFSTPGFGRGTAADVASVADHPPARPSGQLEQSSALSDPAGHMASYYDGIVKNQMIESQNARTGMPQAIEHGLAWLRQLMLLELDETEGFKSRVEDLRQRIEILKQILFEEAIKACKQHDLQAVVTLMSLARQEALETGEEQNPMLDEALECLNFEVEVDATVTEQTSRSGEVSSGTTSGSWQALATVPIDWTGVNFGGTIALGAFTYAAATQFHCSDGSMFTLREAHDGQEAAGTVLAVLQLDLNPREPAPAGQPAPAPPQDSMMLSFNSGPEERYRSWAEGCENDPDDVQFSTNTRWRSLFTGFHGNSSVLNLPIQRSEAPAEVIHTEIFGGSRPIANGTATEDTTIRLRHTPKN